MWVLHQALLLGGLLQSCSITAMVLCCAAQGKAAAQLKEGSSAATT